MKKMQKLAALVLMAMFTLSGAAAAAEEVTVSGTVVCAKCTLKKDDATACQDVLVTKDQSGEPVEYYIVKNEVSGKFEHGCTSQVEATVTGEISEKDGKRWIAPSKMEKRS